MKNLRGMKIYRPATRSSLALKGMIAGYIPVRSYRQRKRRAFVRFADMGWLRI